MSYENNPVYQAEVKNIETVAIDIMENGSMGTASKRLIGDMIAPVLSEVYLFQQSAFKNRGNGKRSNKYFYALRNGWKEGNNKEDYDFLGMQDLQELSELILTDLGLSAELKWDEKKLGQDEGDKLETLKGMVSDLIFKEFPNEFETRILNMLQSAFENGIELRDDSGIVAGSLITPETFTLDIDDPDPAVQRANIRKIKKLFNRINRLNNPLFLRPKTKNGWMVVLSDYMSDWMDEIKAFELNGGDKVMDALLGNNPTKFFKQTPVIINNEMTERNLVMIIPPRGYYASVPDAHSRSGFIGKSATQGFMKIELDGMGYQPSYWMMKFGNPALITDANVIDFANANIKSQDYAGGMDATYNITDGSALTATGYEIVLLDQKGDEVNVADATAVGADTDISYTGLTTGVYRVLVRVKSDKTQLTTTTNYIVSNKAYFIEDETGAGGTTNKSVKSEQKATEVVEDKKAEKKAEKAEAKKEAEDKAEQAKLEAEKEAETETE